MLSLEMQHWTLSLIRGHGKKENRMMICMSDGGDVGESGEGGVW